MRKYLKTKIAVNDIHYAEVRIYADIKDMHISISKEVFDIDDITSTHGLCNNVECFTIDSKGRQIPSNKTSIVFLYFAGAGAGVVTHELMHAVLYAHNRSLGKKQYPIVISSMKCEETILYNHTKVVRAFYKWYWKVESKFIKTN